MQQQHRWFVRSVAKVMAYQLQVNLCSGMIRIVKSGGEK